MPTAWEAISEIKGPVAQGQVEDADQSLLV